MVDRPAAGSQRIVPYLYVEDVDSFLDFLARAFGFVTLVHHVDPGDPDHVHAESALNGAVVMIGKASPRWGTASPHRLPARHCELYVHVDAVDAHFERAREAGARIEAEPEDTAYGHRRYTVRDPEGNRWYFATVNDTASEDRK